MIPCHNHTERKVKKQAQKQVVLMSLLGVEYILRQFCRPWKIFKSPLEIVVGTVYLI